MCVWVAWYGEVLQGRMPEVWLKVRASRPMAGPGRGGRHRGVPYQPDQPGFRAGTKRNLSPLYIALLYFTGLSVSS